MKCFLFLLAAFFSASSLLANEEDLGLFPFYPTRGVAPEVSAPAGADGQVVTDGDRFITAGNGKEIRFWGLNTCFTMNFPEKAEAARYAQRIASFGFNAVRLHHMDRREIWGKNYPKDLTTIDPEMLDRLDWFIYQLKLNGIYVNINLHVSRQFGPAQGFLPEDQGTRYDKGVDNYEPRMIELQKKYAHDLLTHVNPYTKMAYTEDPCVAMIEINNENSILTQYSGGAMDSLGTDYEFPLQKLWNEWLVKKYGTTEKLRAAWSCETFPISENLIGPDLKWVLEIGSGAKASVEVQDETHRLTVEKLGTVAWQPQYNVRTFEVKEGIPYTISFQARRVSPSAGDPPAILSSSVMQSHAPWLNLGFRKEFTLTSEWQDFEFRFLPSASDEAARFGFARMPVGVYEFRNISLKSGGEIGIKPSERLEDGSVRIIYRNRETERNTEAARQDFQRFLVDLETNYWAEMRRFIVEDLHAKAPVTGTQLQYGARSAQAQLDYCDIHSYWNHPRFPGVRWDQKNWFVVNTALANSLGKKDGNLNLMASQRVLGKPYTVSEYNHPYPNLYGAEGCPMIAAMAAFQNWSGIFNFAWSHSTDFNETAAPGFFDLKANSVKLVHTAACRNLFVRGDLMPAEETLEYPLTPEQEREFIAEKSYRWNFDVNPAGFSPMAPLEKRVGIHLGTVPASQTDEPSEEEQVKSVVSAKDGVLQWNAETPDQGVFLVDTPKTKVFTGFIQNRVIEFRNGLKVKLEFGPTLLNWATVSLTELEPNHLLLAATGLQKNQNCELGEYHPDTIQGVTVAEYPGLINKQISFCKKHGTGPVLCEGISARITLEVPKDAAVKCFALDANAQPAQEVEVKRVDETHAAIEISKEFKTLWYEVRFE